MVTSKKKQSIKPPTLPIPSKGAIRGTTTSARKGDTKDLTVVAIPATLLAGAIQVLVTKPEFLSPKAVADLVNRLSELLASVQGEPK